MVAWQSAIAMNADFMHGGLEGNFQGNDQMKMGMFIITDIN